VLKLDFKENANLLAENGNLYMVLFNFPALPIRMGLFWKQRLPDGIFSNHKNHNFGIFWKALCTIENCGYISPQSGWYNL
jgi:hypothetical protein